MITKLQSVSAGSTNTNAITTAAKDFSGCNFIAIIATGYEGVGGTNPLLSTISDSSSNTWSITTGSQVIIAGGLQFVAYLFYAQNPTVTSSQTFSFGNNSSFPAICVAGFSGVDSPANDGSSNHNDGNTTVPNQQPGSITPTQNGDLLVAGSIIIDIGGSTITSVDSGFTIEQTVTHDGANHQGAGLVYLIQGTAGAVNPVIGFAAATRAGSAMQAFKAATVSTSTKHGLPYLGVG